MEQKTKKIKVVVVEPGKRPYVKEIENSLKAMQEIVGGYVEVVYPFDDAVGIMVNEEGKLLSLPLNRALCANGVPYDIIFGTFFIFGLNNEDEADEGKMRGLSEELIEKYKAVFAGKEIFMRTSQGILILDDKGNKKLFALK